MAQTTLEQDVSYFKAAAASFGDKVWISRESHVAVREEIVGRGWGDPGVAFLPEIYAAAIGEMIRTNTLPQRVKTAEELAAEVEAEAQLAAARKRV